MHVRTFAIIGLATQVIFVLAWLIAAAWQAPAYSVLDHSISDMYAVTAPHAWFLVVVLTLCGLGTILFALFGLRPALRGAGWPAAVGVVLLVLSVLGLGDLLSPLEQEACMLADPGCTSERQVENFGGWLDGILTFAGLLLLIPTGFFLAAAMRRLPAWRSLAWPTRIVTIIFTLLFFGGFVVPFGGLMQRLIALTAAFGVAALSVAVLRRPVPAPPI
jgi:hypothetical protein